MPNDLNFTAEDFASIASGVTGGGAPAAGADTGGQGTPTPPPPAAPEEPYPTSWKADYKDHWGKLDPAIRKYVVEREGQVGEGFKKYGAVAKAHEAFERVYKPHQEAMQAAGVTPDQVFNLLLSNHLALQSAPPEQKLGLFKQLVEYYRLQDMLPQLLQGGAVQPGAQPTTPQVPPELVKRLDHIESTVVTRERERVQAEVEAFSKNPANPFFEELAEDISNLLKSGSAKDLPQAYKLALRGNDAVWEKYQKHLAETAQQEAAKKAAAASINVKSSGSPAQPGAAKKTLDETLKEAADRLFQTS